MSVHSGKANSDINVWGLTHNDFHRVLLGNGEYVEVIDNGDNPPSIGINSKFFFWDTDTSYTIPSSQATGNNVYSTGQTPTYFNGQAIFEPVQRDFTWGAGSFPTQADKIFYLWCNGAEDVSSTSLGLGTYGCSTGTPTYNIAKGGWYNASTYRVLAKFTSTGGTVTLDSIYNTVPYQFNGDDLEIKNLISAGSILFYVMYNTVELTPFTVYYDGITIKDQASNLLVATKQGTFHLYSTVVLCLGELGSEKVKLYSSTDNNFYIDNITSDKDVYIRINDGGSTKTAIFIDGSESIVQIPDNIILGIGSANDLQISSTGDDAIINLATTNKDLIFKYQNGVEVFRLDASASYTDFSKDIRIIDGAKLYLGTGQDGQIYSSNDDLYINVETSSKDIVFSYASGGQEIIRLDVSEKQIIIDPNSLGWKMVFSDGIDNLAQIYRNTNFYIDYLSVDQDMYFRINDGGSTKTVIFIDGSESIVQIPDNIFLGIGTANDLQIYSTGDDAILNLATTNKDMIFKVQNGIESFRIDASASNVDFTKSILIKDSAFLYLGTGSDGKIYSNSDDLYIENATTDKDIIFRSQGSIESFRLDASASYIKFTQDFTLSTEAGSTVKGRYLVATDRYAFQSLSFPSAGLLFNVSAARYDFTNTSGNPNFRISANTGGNCYFGLYSDSSDVRFYCNEDGKTDIATATTVAQAALNIDQNDSDMPFIYYNGTNTTDATGNVTNWTTGNAIQKFFKIEVTTTAGSTYYWVPAYSAPTA